MKKTSSFYQNQLFLCLTSVLLGAVIGAICTLFGTVLQKITDFRSNNYLLLLPFLGLAGVLIVWCYNRFGKDSSKGMSLLFEVDRDSRRDIPLILIPLLMISTWLTHLFGGSAGREGAAVQIGGTLGSYVGNKIKVPGANRTLMIAGMAAGFAGLFRTPLAAVIFALEVLRCGTIEYSALLPSLVSAYTANFVSGMLGLEKLTRSLSCETTLDFPVAIRLVALGVIFSLLGMLFSVLLKKAKSVLADLIKKDIIRILISGTIIGLLSLICFHGRYSGLGTNLISAAFSGDIMPWDFVLKMFFTVLTLAAGYYGGEFTPLFSIGASAGFVLAAVFGLPADLCAALGYIAVLGSATNTFFAPVFIGAEIFGTEYMPMFVIVCALAYICNGNKTIYPLQNSEGQGSVLFLINNAKSKGQAI